MQKKIIDLSGKRFGRLIVIGRAPVDRNITKQARWICRCDCGTTKNIVGQSLRLGKSTSCGCLQKEIVSRVNRKPPRPFRNERIIWKSMISRCYNSNNPTWNYYGRRGISICDEWRASFDNFLKSMGPRPTSRHTIERINNDGNYEPINCKWATYAQQMRNKRTTIHITCEGITLCAQDWSEFLHIPISTITRRFHRGLPAADVLGNPGHRLLAKVRAL